MSAPKEPTADVVEFLPRLAPKQNGFWPEAAAVEEAEWLIHGWIPKAATTYLYGTHGTLKSFLIVNMAFCGALGRDHMGSPIDKPFGSIICVGEKKARFGKRIKAWLKAHGVEGQAPAVFTRDGCPDLTDDAAVTDFIDEVNAMKPQFEKRGAPLGAIWLDTLSRALRAGNVSDATTAQAAINSIQRIIDETGCALIPIAHVAKAEGANTIKGAGEFGDSAETYIYVERDKATKVVTATLGKQSDGEDGLKFAFTFELVEVGEGERGAIQSLSLVEVDLPDAHKGTKSYRPTMTPKQALVLRAFQMCMDEQDGVGPMPAGPGIPPGTIGVRRDAVKARAMREGYDDGSAKPESVRRKLNDHMADLIGKGVLRGQEDYVFLIAT
jgi:hypothetical protein